MFVCPRCGTKDKRYFGTRNEKPYCRRCIVFRGNAILYEKRKDNDSRVSLDFELSQIQKECSKKILKSYLQGKDTLVHAVCGAGKTELVYETISFVLSLGLRVGFAIPRRDVVIELFPRISHAFPSNKVIGVYGGHHDDLEADITLLTTHQLYRFQNYFDLLIVDEIDAFPFADNQLLNDFMFRAIRGRHILMSATPSQEIISMYSKKDKNIVELHERFHHQLIPVPKVAHYQFFLRFIFLVKKLKEYESEKKQCLIFFPSIDSTERMFSLLKWIVKNGSAVNSKTKQRDYIVESFKKKELLYLCTTSILERGITIDNVQVIVFDAGSSIFTKETLVQIAGRVGRKAKHPDGDVIFVCKKVTTTMMEAIKDINESNKHLQNML